MSEHIKGNRLRLRRISPRHNARRVRLRRIWLK